VIRFFVYSDYLCPWCFNASVRLESLAEQYEGRVEFMWRSYLLRPQPVEGRDVEKFRAYTRSWLRPAEEADSGHFRVWAGDESPPSHSIPPHCVAKAAARVGPEAFRRMHRRLLEAYFAENRDVSSDLVLRKLWSELELPADSFALKDDPQVRQQVLAEHDEALEAGATGVPAVRLEGNPAIIVGAQPRELYQRWIDRTIARRAQAG